MVGRVGIEPTTNGLRVQGTRAPGARKPKKRNGGFADVRPAVRDRTYAEPYVSGWSGADPSKPRQRLSAAGAEPFPNVRRVAGRVSLGPQRGKPVSGSRYACT